MPAEQRFAVEVEWRGRGSRTRRFVVVSAADPEAALAEVQGRCVASHFWPVAVAKTKRQAGVYTASWRKAVADV